MMPKSTATMRPSSSTKRLPGCMSAWKKPSRSAWRRKVCIRRAAERASRSCPAAASASRSASGMPSIHSSVSTSPRGPRPNRPAARGSPASSLVFSAISESAAASRRRSISMATERRQRVDHGDRPQPARGRRKRSISRAAKTNASRSLLEALLDAGAQHLDRDRLGAPSGVRTSALCTCAIEAAATGGPNSAKSVVDGRAQRRLDGGARLALRERRQAVLQRGEIAGELAADDVGAGGEELAELDVGRAERGQRLRESSAAFAGRRRRAARAAR